MTDSQVQEIKDKLSIVEVVGQYVKLERAGHNYRAKCPFHKEKTPSFNISPERGTYMCFGCGERGDIFSFLEKIENIDFKTALYQLAERAGVTLHRDFNQKSENDKEKDETLRDICESATSFFESKLKERTDVLNYLHDRKITDETITHWRLGYAPAQWREVSEYLVSVGYSKADIAEAGLAAVSERSPGEIYDRFRGRIMFPIFDAGGKVIAFSGRFFEKVAGSKEEGEPAKYVNSAETPLFKKSKVLYGFDRAKNVIRKSDCILLVEGQFDLLHCHQAGLSYAVALSGTALTPEHLQLLGRLSKRLIVALDGDQAGIRAGLKSAQMAIAAGFDVKVPTFPEGKDPADLAREDPEILKNAIRGSKTAVEFFLEALRPGARDERGYKHVVEAQVLPLIAAMASKIEQAHFVRIVANRLGVPEDAVRAEVAKRPTVSFDEAPQEATASAGGGATLSKSERAAALLLFRFDQDAAVQERLLKILGEERLQATREKHLADAERFRFEFDALGVEEQSETIDALFRTVEFALLENEMAKIKEMLRSGAGSEAELIERLSALKRRQEAVRG